MTTDAPHRTRGPRRRPHRLAGTLGPGAIVFMVVAAAAPLTVIAGTVPSGIAAGNGAAYPASYIVCTVVLLFFAVGFTAMARHLPGAGAFYTYITPGPGPACRPRRRVPRAAVLHRRAGRGVRIHRCRHQRFRHRSRRPELPWYVWALAVMAVVAILGYRHIDLSGKVLGVLLICEVGIVLVIDAAVIGRGGGDEGDSRRRRSTPASSSPEHRASR